MAASSSASSPASVYMGPIYDPNSFVITEHPTLYQNYKEIKLIFGWLHNSQRNRFHLEEALLKRKVCHDTINRTVLNPQQLIDILTRVISNYESKYPGDKELYEIVEDFERFCDLGLIPNLTWMVRVNREILNKMYNYYVVARPIDSPPTIGDLRSAYNQIRARNPDKIFDYDDVAKIPITPDPRVDRRYIKFACKYDRLDYIEKYLTRAVSDDPPFIPTDEAMRILVNAAYYGRIEILKLLKSKYPVETINLEAVSPADIETTEFLLEFIQPSIILPGVLSRASVEIFDRFAGVLLPTIDDNSKFEAVAGGSVYLFQKIGAQPSNQMYQTITTNNCIELMVYFRNIGKLNTEEFLGNAVYDNNRWMIRYLHGLGVQLREDEYEFILDLKEMITHMDENDPVNFEHGILLDQRQVVINGLRYLIWLIKQHRNPDSEYLEELVELLGKMEE